MEHINRMLPTELCINRGHNLKITAFIIVCYERLNRRGIRSEFCLTFDSRGIVIYQILIKEARVSTRCFVL